MERLLDIHLRDTKDASSLSSNQRAYTKGISTETALHSLVSTIEKSLAIKDFTMVAFTDIEGAFNNITPEASTRGLWVLSLSQDQPVEERLKEESSPHFCGT